MMQLLEAAGNRFVTKTRTRNYATIVTLVTTVVYGIGLAKGRGLVDGFGHVIGGDLLTLRLAATMVRNSQGPRLYDFGLQTFYQQQAVAPVHLPGLNPFITPPFVALVFWPWSFLSPGVAFALWSVLSVAMLGLAIWLATASKGFDGSARRLAMIGSLSFFPVLEGLMAGNTSLLSLLFFTLIFLALKRRRDGLAGALLGLLLIKPQLVLAMVIVLVWKRRWRALGGFVGIGIVWGALSVTLVDLWSPVSYLRTLPGLTRLAFVEGFPYSLLSSIYALFLVPLGPARFELATILGSLTAAGLVAIMLKVWSGAWRPESTEFDLRFAFTLIITCLISQYILLHDLAILILSVILLANYWLRTDHQRGWGAVRFCLAVVWTACFLGPLLTQSIRVPLVPVALLLLVWANWLTIKHSTRIPTVIADTANSCMDPRQALGVG